MVSKDDESVEPKKNRKPPGHYVQEKMSLLMSFVLIGYLWICPLLSACVTQRDRRKIEGLSSVLSKVQC